MSDGVSSAGAPSPSETSTKCAKRTSRRVMPGWTRSFRFSPGCDAGRRPEWVCTLMTIDGSPEDFSKTGWCYKTQIDTLSVLRSIEW